MMQKLHFLAVKYSSLLLFSAFVLVARPADAAPMNFTINLSEPVMVNTAGGTPSVALTVGDQTRAATYSGGSGTHALTFSYAPQPGDYDMDGVALASPVALNGATIKDSAGNNAVLTFTPPDISGVKVDYPSLLMDFTANTYRLNAASYTSLASFLAAAGGTFSRNSVGTYFDASGVLQTASANTPRFDHDPVSHAAKGILIEESRTNYVANSAMSGGGAGTWPTSWNAGGNNGLSASVVGAGMANGMPYIDIRVSGTSTGTVNKYYNISLSNGQYNVPSGNNVAWTHSCYLSVAAGSMTGFLSASINISAGGAGANYLGEVGSSSILTASNTVQRFLAKGTTWSASTTGVQPYFQLNAATGVAVDVTLRFAAPQLEQGTFATSFIPTSGSTVTRAADDLVIPTGTWFSATAGTLVGESFGQLNSNQTNYGRIIGTSDSSNKVFLGSGTDLRQVQIWPGTGGALTITMATAVSPTVSARMATAWREIDKTHALAATGASLKDSSYVGDYTSSNIRIGAGSGGSVNYRNACIKKVAYYPARLPDASLQALTQ